MLFIKNLNSPRSLSIIKELSTAKKLIYELKNPNANNQKLKSQSQRFENEYPHKTAKDLKIEIEKISDMLLGNEESNRYTYRLQEKASNDRKLERIRKIIPDNVSLLTLKDHKLKAQVNYLNENKEYTIIMYMDVVAKGRVFLKKYKTMKREVEI